MKHKHRKTTGVQGSGQSTHNNTGNSSKKQTFSKTEISIPILENVLGTKIFKINSNTNLKKLGNDIIYESSLHNKEIIKLVVDCANTFNVDEIENLGSIINRIPTMTTVQVKGDIDFVELLFMMLCNNCYSNGPKEFKISMNSLVPISDTDIERISKKLAEKLIIDADEISEYFKNKTVISADMILPKLELD